MKHCKSCGAEIIWATTVAEKRIPLDAVPLMKFVQEPGSSKRNLVVRLTAVYESHFATCPNAAEHRKKIRSDNRKVPNPPPVGEKED